VKLSWILRQSSIYLVGDFLRRALGVILLPFYTHYLSTSDYGTIELLDLFILVANVSLGALAIGDAMIRIYYEEREGEQSPVVSTALWSIVAISAVLAGAGIALAAPASLLLFHKPGYENLIRMAFLAMFCGNIVETGLVYQRLKQRARFFILLSGGLLALNAGLNIYYIAVAKWGLRGFFWGKCISAALGAAILLVGIVREVHWTFRRDLAARIMRFGAPLILSGFAVFVIHYSDRFFLDRYSTLAEIGIYAVAYKFGFLISNLVGAPFGNAWNVNMYGYVSSPGWQREFARVFRYLLFFLVLAGLGLSVTSDEALALLAPAAYGGAAVLVPIVVLAYVVREVGDFFRGVMFVNKRVRLFSAVTCVCALLNLALNQSLIPRYGARGAAWSTLFTWLAYMIFCWTLAHREHRLPFPLGSLAQIFGLAGVVYAVAAGVNRLPAPWQWGPDVLLVLLWVGLLWMSGYFPVEDRQTVRNRLALWRAGRLAGVASGGQS
jgi:O-antigen/teichoic acid export membrane protein